MGEVRHHQATKRKLLLTTDGTAVIPQKLISSVCAQLVDSMHSGIRRRVSQKLCLHRSDLPKQWLPSTKPVKPVGGGN